MPRFNGICLITRDVDRLAAFYQDLLRVEIQRDGDNVLFMTGGTELSIFSSAGMERMAHGSMAGAGYGSYTIEIEVEDVDAEFARLTGRGTPVVKPPETYPWSRRSAWFRDPDGNIVNLFMNA